MKSNYYYSSTKNYIITIRQRIQANYSVKRRRVNRFNNQNQQGSARQRTDHFLKGDQDGIH
jgi:hypothetical protein